MAFKTPLPQNPDAITAHAADSAPELKFQTGEIAQIHLVKGHPRSEAITQAVQRIFNNVQESAVALTSTVGRTVAATTLVGLTTTSPALAGFAASTVLMYSVFSGSPDRTPPVPQKGSGIEI
jgi:hypothetical protein